MAFNNLIDLARLERFLDNVKLILNGKVDKETGKGLSSNDYTTEEKNKLSGIAAGAQVNSLTGVKGDSEASYRTGDVNITKANIGLGNVENKSSATIRGELTSSDVTTALGYTPPATDTTYDAMTESEAKTGTSETGKLISAAVLDAAIENKGYTGNTGTITGITMNGASKGTSGVVDLGTVITAHQDISGKLDTSLKGAANGLAELDADGKVPSSQLPSYVDDIVEYNGQSAFPATGESGKIYLDTSTNKCYRWSGSAYVFIASDLALGTTSSTAFRGDYGASAYAHGVTNKGSAFASGLYKITTNSEGHVTAAAAVEKSDITGLGIPAQDTTYSDATTSASGLMSSTDKAKLDGVAAGAQANVIESVSVNGSALTPTSKGVNVTVPTKLTDLTNDGDFVSDANYVHTDSNYTAAEKTKLSGVETGSQANVLEGVKVNGAALTITNKAVNVTVPTKTSDLTNDSNFPVDASYVHTDNNYTTTEKNKLSGIEAEANKTVVDSALSSSSENPVQNKVVKAAIETALPLAGGTMSGNIAMGSNSITGLAAPTSDGDAARKKYVDDTVGALVKTASGTISTSATSVEVSFSGTFINAYALMGGSLISLDIAVAASKITFTCAASPSAAVTCVVVYA